LVGASPGGRTLLAATLGNRSLSEVSMNRSWGAKYVRTKVADAAHAVASAAARHGCRLVAAMIRNTVFYLLVIDEIRSVRRRSGSERPSRHVELCRR
jgi:hypothetical protein